MNIERSMNWLEIDKLTLTADWLDSHNFIVKRIRVLISCLATLSTLRTLDIAQL